MTGAKLIIRGILIGLLWTTAGLLSAQHYLGVRGGYGGGSVRFDPEKETALLIGFPSGGISWKYYSPQRVVGGIQVDIQRVTKGYKQYFIPDPDLPGEYSKEIAFERTLDAIEMPFFWQPHVYLFNDRARVFLNLGVYASYIIASDSCTRSKVNGVEWGKTEYPMRSIKDNSFEYGLCGGVGIGVFIKRFEVVLEARYSYGYSDLYKNRDKYTGTEPDIHRTPHRSAMDMINISMGVYYRLGKGGILAPPSERRSRTRDYRPDDDPLPGNPRRNNPGRP